MLYPIELRAQSLKGKWGKDENWESRNLETEFRIGKKGAEKMKLWKAGNREKVGGSSLLTSDLSPLLAPPLKCCQSITIVVINNIPSLDNLGCERAFAIFPFILGRTSKRIHKPNYHAKALSRSVSINLLGARFRESFR